MSDNLTRLEASITAMHSTGMMSGKVEAMQLLAQMKSIAGNLSDAFDTLEYQTNDLNDRVNQQMAILDKVEPTTKRVNERTVELAKSFIELEKKVDNLSDVILRSLKQLPVKGAEDDGDLSNSSESAE